MKSVIIVDDEQEILNMLQKALTRKNLFDVKTYSNPKDGMSAILTQQPDIVLLDIMMPELSGIEILEQIKIKSKNTKVIMMTAYSSLDKVLKTHRTGANSYILKPFESLKDVEEKVIALSNI